ncbi:uncharacterized protein [Branchiostoma lanceolatum]|uniref:uncharacterized protein isoform X1 n=1 Tax=Branchiostoma lanceolatum TaxID=7740 RepID=UPI0034553A3B
MAGYYLSQRLTPYEKMMNEERGLGAADPRAEIHEKVQQAGIPLIQETDYQIVENGLVGVGTFGKVYKGTYDEDEVAVKEIQMGRKVKLTDHQIREIQIHGLLPGHKNVASLLVVSIGKNLRMICNYIDGRSLDEIIFEEDEIPKILKPVQIPAHEEPYVALQIAEGVAHLHDCGIIHRDLKPENVMVNTKRHAFICDLGTAKVEQHNNLSVIESMMKPGSPIFLAPECSVDGLDADYASDIWSLGCTLAELFAREEIWETEDIEFELKGHLKNRKEPDGLKDVREPFKTLVRKLLSYDPKNRITAFDAVTELQKTFDWKKYEQYKDLTSKPGFRKRRALSAPS